MPPNIVSRPRAPAACEEWYRQGSGAAHAGDECAMVIRGVLDTPRPNFEVRCLNSNRRHGQSGGRQQESPQFHHRPTPQSRIRSAIRRGMVKALIRSRRHSLPPPLRLVPAPTGLWRSAGRHFEPRPLHPNGIGDGAGARRNLRTRLPAAIPAPKAITSGKATSSAASCFLHHCRGSSF